MSSHVLVEREEGSWCGGETDICRFVQTDMGAIFAEVLGIEKPPLTPDESAAAVLRQASAFFGMR